MESIAAINAGSAWQDICCSSRAEQIHSQNSVCVCVRVQTHKRRIFLRAELFRFNNPIKSWAKAPVSSFLFLFCLRHFSPLGGHAWELGWMKLLEHLTVQHAAS